MHFIREVKVRYGRRNKVESSIISSHSAASFIRKRVIQEDNKEHFVLLCLDGSHSVVAYNLVSIGTANYSVVHPREVFQPALLAGAVSIIVAHNHPSGNLTPSEADINVTEQLSAAGKLLGIKLLDHIILSDCDHISLQDKGYIK